MLPAKTTSFGSFTLDDGRFNPFCGTKSPSFHLKIHDRHGHYANFDNYRRTALDKRDKRSIIYQWQCPLSSVNPKSKNPGPNSIHDSLLDFISGRMERQQRRPSSTPYARGVSCQSIVIIDHGVTSSMVKI